MEMNQLCKVCGEPAAGFHFGAFTCEGCKSFFGRTYNNLSSLSECKNSGRCIINKKNRTSCKSCRLRKCLMVGMSKSGSRYGRRSNWFKIHCLLQDQANMNGQLHDVSSITNGDMAQKCVYDPSSRSNGGVNKGDLDRDHVDDCKDDDELMMTGSPADSHSDSCGGDMDHDIKPLNGCYDASNNKVQKSGSLSPLSSYESPSPPYDKLKDSMLTATSTTSSSASSYLHQHHHHHNNNLHLPMSPLSPISPLVTFQQQQKFFGQVAAAGLLGHHPNGLIGNYHGSGVGAGSNPLAFRPYAPLSNFDMLLKKRKAFVFDLANSCNSSTGSSCVTTSTSKNKNTSTSCTSTGASEQDVPIDLSLKRTGVDKKSSSSDKTKTSMSNDDDDEDDDNNGNGDSNSNGTSGDQEVRSVETPLDLTLRS